MNLRFRSHVFAGIAAILLIGATIAAGHDYRSSAHSEPWPSFQMTYRIQGGSEDGQVWRLVYRSKHEWREELLIDATDPTMLGPRRVSAAPRTAPSMRVSAPLSRRIFQTAQPTRQISGSWPEAW